MSLNSYPAEGSSGGRARDTQLRAANGDSPGLGVVDYAWARVRGTSRSIWGGRSRAPAQKLCRKDELEQQNGRSEARDGVWRSAREQF